MMQHKYPFTVLHFQLDGDLLDVNVHPTKMELRFSDQEGMYRLVYETVRNALVGREMIPDVHVGKEAPAPKEPPKKESFPEPFEVKRREAMMQEKRAEAKKRRPRFMQLPGQTRPGLKQPLPSFVSAPTTLLPVRRAVSPNPSMRFRRI